MDRIEKPELPKSPVELPNSGTDLGGGSRTFQQSSESKSGFKPIYSYAVAPDRMDIAPSSWRGPGPHGGRAPASPPDSGAGFYAFGARRYAEPDLNVWRSVGPGWAIAWAIASVFAALLVINLLASVVP